MAGREAPQPRRALPGPPGLELAMQFWALRVGRGRWIHPPGRGRLCWTPLVLSAGARWPPRSPPIPVVTLVPPARQGAGGAGPNVETFRPRPPCVHRLHLTP